MHELLPGVEERNYSKTPLTAEEIREIVTAAGGVRPILNTSHATAKTHGWKDAPPLIEVFVAAAVLEPNLLRRPIVVANGRVVVGKSEAGWRALGG